MALKPTYAVRSFTIPANGSVEAIRDADFITCLEASAAFKMSLDNAPRVDFEAGLTLTTVSGFKRIEMINPTGDALTVKVGFGKGDVKDARLTLSGAVNTRVDAPGGFVTGPMISAADAATTALKAANGNREEILISNDGAGKVYICGDPAAAAGEGLPLAPGGAMVLTTAAAIYARNDSGAAVNLAVAELERV